jgi:hypothetical protein
MSTMLPRTIATLSVTVVLLSGSSAGRAGIRSGTSAKQQADRYLATNHGVRSRTGAEQQADRYLATKRWNRSNRRPIQQRDERLRLSYGSAATSIAWTTVPRPRLLPA